MQQQKSLRDRMIREMQNQKLGDLALATEMEVPYWFVVRVINGEDVAEFPSLIQKANAFMDFINGTNYGLHCKTEYMSALDVYGLPKSMRIDILTNERNYIRRNGDFKILGIAARDFVLEENTGLYKIKDGTCRVTAHQLFVAMRDKMEKRKLEYAIKLGGCGI